MGGAVQRLGEMRSGDRCASSVLRSAAGRQLVALVSLVAALMVTGCMPTTAEIQLHDDRSGVLNIEARFDGSVRTRVEDLGLETVLVGAIGEIPGADFAVDSRMGRSIYTVTIPFEHTDALSTGMLEGSGSSGRQFAPFSAFELTDASDPDGWLLNATTRPLSEMIQPGSDDLGDSLAALFAAGATQAADGSVSLSITMPGRVTSSNATVSDKDGISGDRTATWVFADPFMAHEINATAERVPTVSPLQWVLIAAVAVLFVGLLLMFSGASGRSRAAARSGATQRVPSGRTHLRPPQW